MHVRTSCHSQSWTISPEHFTFSQTIKGAKTWWLEVCAPWLLPFMFNFLCPAPKMINLYDHHVEFMTELLYFRMLTATYSWKWELLCRLDKKAQSSWFVRLRCQLPGTANLLSWLHPPNWSHIVCYCVSMHIKHISQLKFSTAWNCPHAEGRTSCQVR